MYERVLRRIRRRLNGGIDVPLYKPGEKVAEEAFTKQIAALAAAGTKPSEIGKQLNLKPKEVKDILNSEECKKYMIQIGQEAVGAAKETIRARTAAMATKFLDALEKNLEKGNVQAFGTYLKIMGFGENGPEQADTNITVMFPSSPEPKDVTPKPETIEVKLDG